MPTAHSKPLYICAPMLPQPLQPTATSVNNRLPQRWLIVGASRGIGLEFVRQLLQRGDIVIATARAPPASSPSPSVESGSASKLWPLTGTVNGANLKILECDVSEEKSIKGFVGEVERLGRKGGVLEFGGIDCVVLNAGVLVYPNRISELTFSAFAHHLHTNTIGPLITAQQLLATQIHIGTLVFISSDSASASNFRSFEDGFGAYAASKAALNQSLRHLAAELHRKASIKSEIEWGAPVVLAIHPGEVMTDMAANVSLDWDVEGIISVQESVRCVLSVIEEKGAGGKDEGGRVSAEREGRRFDKGEATFWTWEGNRYPW